MNYTVLDLSSSPRRAHFAYFSRMANPYVGVTVPVDITRFVQVQKAKELPFFLSFLWCVSRAANAVPQLRRRILSNDVIEYDFCPTSHTVALPDGTYAYCTLNAQGDFDAFLPDAVQKQQAAKENASVEESESDSLPLLFISTLPWLSYTGLVQPTPYPADSNPRITWGKYERQTDGRILLPVTLLCHHALVDGLHLSAFYEQLNHFLALWVQSKE